MSQLSLVDAPVFDPKRGVFDFSTLDTSESGRCLFASLPGESEQAFVERLRVLWRTNPQAKQHLFVYARRYAKGNLAVRGPHAAAASKVLSGLLQSASH